MAQFNLSLLVVVLSVLVPTFAGWNQLGGGRPGFGQVGFGDGSCSAIQGILPEPRSGCCGKHAEVGDSPGADNSGDQEDDNGNGNSVDDGYEQGGEYGNGYGPGDDDDQGYMPGDNDEDDGSDFENGNGLNFGNGNDFDFGNWDWNSGWGVGSNKIGDFDFGRLMSNGENRFKRSADKNASDVAPDKYVIGNYNQNQPCS